VLVLQLCGLAVLAGSAAIAEDEIVNALANGDFDQDVAGWEIAPAQLPGSNEVTIAFDSNMDVDDDPTSGAALVGSKPFNGFNLYGYMVQCVAVDPLRRHAFEGSLYVASGQGSFLNFSARFDVDYYRGEDCNGQLLRSQSTEGVSYPGSPFLDSWQTYTLPEQLPPEETGSVLVSGVIASVSGTLYGHTVEARFDAVILSVPEPCLALQQATGLLVLLGLARRRAAHSA
jgi:hypothetical protein